MQSLDNFSARSGLPPDCVQVKEERERRRVEGFTALLEEAVELGAQLEVLEGGEEKATGSLFLSNRLRVMCASSCKSFIWLITDSRVGQGDRHTT